MAIAAIAGLASAASAALAITAITFTQLAVAFAIGAGLSMVSRALAPKPSLGAQLRGITQTTREPAGTRKLIYGQMRVGGNVVFIEHSGSDNKYLHLVVVFATHHINSFEEFYFNDKKIWTLSGGFQGNWGTYVQLNTKLGTDTQDAVSSLVSASSKWTNDHKLSGIAYAHFRLEWDADEFPQGVPNITAVIKGKRVYDPRTQVFAYSDNPALCLRDYMIDQDYGLGETALNINTQSVIDAANLCEEQVSLDGGGTQDRYTCNGVIDTNNQIKDNIEQLLSAMGGRLTYSGGEYFVNGAEYQAPTVTFDEGDCISDIQTQTKQSRRSVFNGVKGIFVSEEKNYKVLDYPPQISSTFATEDGDPIFLDMPLPFVTNNTQAQRLAKIALLKSRQQVIITMAVNLKGLQVKVGDTINVTNDRLGYSSKVFEVVEYSLAIADGGSLAVNLTCIETAAAVYDWNTSDEEDFLAGGELDLYDGRTVDNVTFTASDITEIGLLGPDGGVNSSVQLVWTAPDDAFIEFYKIRYNKNGTTDYFEVETRETRIILSGLEVNQNYDFRIQAQNLIGVSSTGTTVSNVLLEGDDTLPELPAGLQTTGGIRNITVTWTNPSDIDLKQIEVHVVDTNTTPATGATPEAVITGEEYVYPTGSASAVTKYFFLRAVDFSGNKSAYTAGVAGTSLQVTGEDIGAGEIQGGTLALLLNQSASGLANNGEGALVGVNLDGTANMDSDGFILYNGDQITIEHDQYNNFTFLTEIAGKRGYIAFDINKTAPFQMSGSFGDLNCAFVHIDSGTFYYDDNSSTRVSFNPNSFTGTQTGTDGTTTAHVVSLGVLETNTADNILAGGLYGQPRDLVTVEIPPDSVGDDQIYDVTGEKIIGEITSATYINASGAEYTKDSADLTAFPSPASGINYYDAGTTNGRYYLPTYIELVDNDEDGNVLDTAKLFKEQMVSFTLDGSVSGQPHRPIVLLDLVFAYDDSTSTTFPFPDVIVRLYEKVGSAARNLVKTIEYRDLPLNDDKLASTVFLYSKSTATTEDVTYSFDMRVDAFDTNIEQDDGDALPTTYPLQAVRDRYRIKEIKGLVFGIR